MAGGAAEGGIGELSRDGLSPPGWAAEVATHQKQPRLLALEQRASSSGNLGGGDEDEWTWVDLPKS